MKKIFEQYQMTDDKELIKEHSKGIKALLSQSYWANPKAYLLQGAILTVVFAVLYLLK